MDSRFQSAFSCKCVTICAFLTVFGKLSNPRRMSDHFDTNCMEVEEKCGFASTLQERQQAYSHTLLREGMA